jgi:tetratricopeptide (TPR) repeat protein
LRPACACGEKGGSVRAVRHEHTGQLSPGDATAHTNLGNALQDKGQRDEAMKEYRQAIALDPKLAQAHGALGQALLAQGQFAEARAATSRCLDLLPEKHSLRKFVTQQLQGCERWLALEEKLPAILQGEAKPADTAEQFALAQLCRQYKKLHAASARFYLRLQALDGLRADLTAWTKVLDKASPQDRLVVHRTLQRWQKDPALAGMREEAALAKLPETERTAYRQLWADVGALRTRTEPKAKPVLAPKKPGPREP